MSSTCSYTDLFYSAIFSDVYSDTSQCVRLDRLSVIFIKLMYIFTLNANIYCIN